ncbi:GD19758 [Drosophila simulans]|uniref:GD19758 n=1 Tax=Drosophila simulans TaxID=7240 RepID=B4QW71_DROSI|nr:GD19758 [Drosophila simulans]
MDDTKGGLSARDGKVCETERENSGLKIHELRSSYLDHVLGLQILSYYLSYLGTIWTDAFVQSISNRFSGAAAFLNYQNPALWSVTHSYSPDPSE